MGGDLGWIRSVAFSRGGWLRATGSVEGTVRRWRLADGALLRTVEGTGIPEGLPFTSDGLFLGAGCWDGTVRLWGVAP